MLLWRAGWTFGRSGDGGIGTHFQNDVGLGLELNFAISLSLNKLTENNVTTFSTVSCSTHGAMGDTQNVKFFECKKHACEAISSSCKLSVSKVLDFLYLFGILISCW